MIYATNSTDIPSTDNQETQIKTENNENQIIYANSKGNNESNGKSKDNPTTLNNALEKVQNNDTIQLITDTEEDTYESITIDRYDKPEITFTLEAAPGKHIILNGNEKNLIEGTNYNITLKNLDITNYTYIRAPSNTIATNYTTTLTIENCNISDSGNIYSNNNNLTVNNTRFYNNHADDIIFKNSTSNNDTCIINNSIFANNTGNTIINALSDTILINNVSFITNTLSNMLISNNADMTIMNSTITDNSALLNIIQNNKKLNYVKNYNQNNKALQTFINGDANIILYDTNLTISTEKTEYQSNEALKIKAELTNEINKNINTGIITFKINGNNITENITSEVKDNKAEVCYFIPKDAEGELNVQATFTDQTENITRIADETYINMSLYNSSNSNNLKLNITPVNASLNLILSNDTVNVDENIQFSITLNTSKPVNSGKVIFKLDDKTLKDENGNVLFTRIKNNTATLTYKIPDGTKKDYHKITAIFGNGEYKRLSDDKIFKVNPINVTIDCPTTVTVNSYMARINGTVKDINNHYVVGNHKMCIKINGVTVRDNKNSPLIIYTKNGTFDTTFQLPDNIRPGTYNFTVVSGERTSYKKGIIQGKLVYDPDILLKGDTTICNDSKTIYKTMVTDKKGNNINKGKIELFNGLNKITESNITDGQALLQLDTLPNNTESITFKIRYTDENGKKTLQKTQKVTIRNPSVTLTTQTEPRIKQDTDTTIKTYVKDKNGKNVCSGIVNYTLQSEQIGTANVTNGVATLTTHIPAEYLGRNYVINATFISKNYDQIKTQSTMVTITE